MQWLYPDTGKGVWWGIVVLLKLSSSKRNQRREGKQELLVPLGEDAGDAEDAYEISMGVKL